MLPKDKEIVTIFVTKYALTSGIHMCQAEVDGTMAKVLKVKFPEYHHGNDWHRTYAEAAAHAEKMRVKKLAATKKRVKTLEALSFRPTPPPHLVQKEPADAG